MANLLKNAGWLACVIYATIPSFWMLIHPRAAYWRSRTRSPYRILLPLWTGMWIVLGLVTAPWRTVVLYNTPWTWLPAVVLFLAGLTIYKISGAGFSAAQLGGLPELTSVNQNQHLITTGIRARVRHPVYLGHLCELLAWSIGTGLAVCYVLTAFAVLTGAVMIPMEDKELATRFGPQYIDYRKRVAAIFPKL